MLEEYKLNDLIRIIERTALDMMSEPIFGAKKQDGSVMTMAEISFQNSLTAMHNEGIREFAGELIERLSVKREDACDD